MAYTDVSSVGAELQTSFSSSTSPTDSEVETWIGEADALINLKTDKKWDVNTVSDVVFAISEDSTYSYYRLPNMRGGRIIGNSTFQLRDDRNLPVKNVLSITHLYLNDTGETDADNWTELDENTGSGGDFVLDKVTGRITLLNVYVRNTKRSFKWSGTYGGDASSDEYMLVHTIATKLVAIRVLNALVNTKAKKVTTRLSIGSISLERGISTLRDWMGSLKTEVDELFKSLGVLDTQLAW